jgi:HD-like signal output (HDOD) protein
MNTSRLQAGGLPPLPYIAHEILLATLDERNDAARLAELLRQEPGIAARVVAAANAAWFLGRAPATELRDAVVRLGITRLRVLVTALMLNPVFDSRRCPAFDAAEFWQRAVAGAFAAGKLTDEPPWNVHRGQGELATLLHRIGLLVLAHALPAETQRALEAQRCAPERTLAACLREHTGSTLAEASVLLLREWNLPHPIVQAAAETDDGSAGEFGLGHLVRVADSWVTARFDGVPEGLEMLPEQRRQQLASACRAEWDKLSAMAALLAGG